MSYSDFKEVANIDPGDSTHYGSDDLLDIVKIFNNKVVATRRINIKNPFRFSDKIEIAAPNALPSAPTSTNYVHLVLDPADFHLKVQQNGGGLTDLQVFALETNTLAYTSPSSNVAGDLLKNNSVKYVRFPRGTSGQILASTSGDIAWSLLTDSNVDAAAAVGWTKISKTGSKMKDIADCSTMTAPSNGQVPTWNNGAQRWDAATPPGSGTGEANTCSNIGTAGVGIYKQKTSVNFELKKINAGSNKITVTDDTGNNEVDIDVAQANLTLSSIGGAVTDSQTPTAPTGRTYGIDTNTIKHSTTNAQGDILAYDTTATKYIRIPRGTNGQHLVATATDIQWATPTAIPTVYGGVATFSGNGSTTTFAIPHGAGTTPTKYSVTPASLAANHSRTYPAEQNGSHWWITVDSTNLTVNWGGTAPPAGTNNLSWAWMVIV